MDLEKYGFNKQLLLSSISADEFNLHLPNTTIMLQNILEADDNDILYKLSNELNYIFVYCPKKFKKILNHIVNMDKIPFTLLQSIENISLHHKELKHIYENNRFSKVKGLTNEHINILENIWNKLRGMRYENTKFGFKNKLLLDSFYIKDKDIYSTYRKWLFDLEKSFEFFCMGYDENDGIRYFYSEND